MWNRYVGLKVSYVYFNYTKFNFSIFLIKNWVQMYHLQFSSIFFIRWRPWKGHSRRFMSAWFIQSETMGITVLLKHQNMSESFLLCGKVGDFRIALPYSSIYSVQYSSTTLWYYHHHGWLLVDSWRFIGLSTFLITTSTKFLFVLIIVIQSSNKKFI